MNKRIGVEHEVCGNTWFEYRAACTCVSSGTHCTKNDLRMSMLVMRAHPAVSTLMGNRGNYGYILKDCKPIACHDYGMHIRGGEEEGGILAYLVSRAPRHSKTQSIWGAKGEDVWCVPML